jgi:putative protease
MATKKKAKRKTTAKKSAAKRKKSTVRKAAARKKTAPAQEKRAKKAPVRRATRKTARPPAQRPAPARPPVQPPREAARPMPSPPARPAPSQERIGVVSHYYSHLSVATVKLESGTLRVGDKIHIHGHTSDFVQKVESLEVDHGPVSEVGPGDDFGLKVVEHAREPALRRVTT